MSASTASSVAQGTWREFHFTEGSSNKFWRIQIENDSFTVRYGRIGTQGQEQTKSYDDAAEAEKEYNKLVAEKLKKGYVEIGGAQAPAPSPVDKATPAKKGDTGKGKDRKASEKETTSSAPEAEPSIPGALRQSSSATPLSRSVKHELHLDPTDWFWAMWRDPEPLARPQPPEFDQADR